MAGVSIHRVAKRFGNTPILNDIDFDIADGEFLVLVGPSGCGKSTLLRMIAGLEDIDSGEIRIGERVVNDLPVKARDIAMVFQSYALYPHLTVRQNMGFSLSLARRPKAECERRVAQAAQVLSLEPLLARYPRELSGGQRQRVAMGRAIVRDPQVFLFDEPLSNLDAKLRVQMRAEIKELHQRLGSTIVYVTHDQIEAMTMADRIVVMRAGRIEQIGTPLGLYDKPANAFVATFIGSPSMNLIEGVVDADGRLRASADAAVVLPLPRSAKLSIGRRLLYGVRPEGFALAAGGISCQVAVLEPTGPETHILARFGEHKLTIVVHERLTLGVGQQIQLLPREGAVHLFDAGSGQRIEV